jgi:hypothetical protein
LKTSSVYETVDRKSFKNFQVEESPVLRAKNSNERYSYEYMEIIKVPEVEVESLYMNSKTS